METVFDYNITDKEREDIGISEKENYLAFIDEESANWGIAQLMYYRGDKKQAAKYASSVVMILRLSRQRAVLSRYSRKPIIHLGVISLNVVLGLQYRSRCLRQLYQFPQFPRLSGLP